MAAECANPLLLQWLGEWLEMEKTRNTMAVTVYKKAYASMKACPLRFDHPSEAQQLNGLGPKLCARLTEKMITFCQENGLPEPKMPSRRKRALANSQDGEAITEGDYIPPPKRPRKPKPYVPQLRSGPYALIIALSALPDDPSASLSKQQLIELAQEHCDSSFTAPSDPTKFFTAWNSMKTLVEKGVVWERGRPVKRYALSEEGWEVARRMRNVEAGRGGNAGMMSCAGSASGDGQGSGEDRWVGVGPSRRWIEPGEEDGEDLDLELGAPPKKTKKTVAERRKRKEVAGFVEFGSTGAIDREVDRGLWIGVGPSRRWVEPGDDDYEELKLEQQSLKRAKKTAVMKSKGTAKGGGKAAVLENADSSVVVSGEGRREGVRPDREWIEPGDMDDDIYDWDREKKSFKSGNSLDGPGPVLKKTSSSDYLQLLTGRGLGVSPKMDKRKENQPFRSSNSLDDILNATSTSITSFDWELPSSKGVANLDDSKENRPLDSGNPLDDLLDPASAAMAPADFWESVRSSASKPKTSKKDRLFGSSDSLDDLFPSENLVKPPLNSAFTTGSNMLGGVPKNKFSWRKVPESTMRDTTSTQTIGDDNDDIEILSSPPPRLPAKPNNRSLSRTQSGSNSSGPTTAPKPLDIQTRTSQPPPPPPQKQQSTQALPSFAPIILPPSSFTVRLVLDTREVRTKTDRDYMSAELAKKGTPPLMRSLDLGDALWVAKCNDPSLLSKYGEEGDEVMLDWIVERKRLDDLVGSIKDGRFSEQKFRLRRSGVKRVVYIIEEISMQAETMTKWAEAVGSAIATVQVVNGWFCKRTAKMDETIRYLARMTSLLKSLYEGKALSVIPSGDITPETYLPLLRGMSGVDQVDDDGDDAARLKVSFLTFSSLVSKSEGLTLRDVFLKMLMCIRGISGEKALEIQRVWKTPRELFEAFEACRTTEEREKLVEEGLKHVVSRRRVGRQISRRVGEVWGGI